MTWITRLALKKRWATVLVAALVAGASVWATLDLKMELIPDIDLPMTTVITIYPQAQAEEVMAEVTVPVEIRERLGIQPGTEVEFEIVGDTVVLRKAHDSRRRGRSARPFRA